MKMDPKRDDYLKEFSVKKCNVDLPKITFSKIRIACTVEDSTGKNLLSDLKQVDMNTFSIKIKRKKYDNFNDEGEDPNVLHARKKLKLIATELKDLSKGPKLRSQHSQKPSLAEVSRQITPDKGKKNKKNNALVKPRSIIKPKPCERVEIGQIVLCKMRGFAEWPALVIDIHNNLITIQFFGDNTTHKAALNNFFKFEDCHDIILNHIRTKKTPLYTKSVLEAERVLGIPTEKSLINQINN